jgi:hypothetical protein
MGEIPVHPLDGMELKKSIKNTISILSIPIAPELHHKIYLI